MALFVFQYEPGDMLRLNENASTKVKVHMDKRNAYGQLLDEIAEYEKDWDYLVVDNTKINELENIKTHISNTELLPDYFEVELAHDGDTDLEKFKLSVGKRGAY